MIPTHGNGSYSDPVSKAKFRSAKKDEVKEARGNFLWRAVSSPWEVARKILGTGTIAMAGPDILRWQRSYFQSFIEKISYWSGYNPEELFMTTLYTYIIGNIHSIEGSTKVLKAFFKHHRHEEIFASSHSMKKFYSIFQQVFPNDPISPEQFMMTCSSKNTKIYRALLHKLLGGANSDKLTSEISSQVEETLKSWHASCQKGVPVNASHETRILASSIISQILFKDSSQSKKIATSVDFMNRYVVKSILKTNTKEDTDQYEKEMNVFRQAVEEILTNENLPLFNSSTKDWSAAQKKALISVLFFAGQETTASLLSWMLRQLALSPKKQETIYQSLKNLDNQSPSKQVDQSRELDQFFHCSIGEFTPPVGVNRILKEHVCLEYRLVNETTIRKKILFKGDTAVALLWKRAQQELNSGKMELDYKKWLPFGSGAHSCPGEKLANEQIKQVVAKLVSKFIIKTDQIQDIPKLGYVTLKLKEDVIVTITPREEIVRNSIPFKRGASKID